MLTTLRWNHNIQFSRYVPESSHNFLKPQIVREEIPFEVISWTKTIRVQIIMCPTKLYGRVKDVSFPQQFGHCGLIFNI